MCLLFIAASALFTGCSTGNDAAPQTQISEIEITPDSVAIEPGESVKFLATALDGSGDEVQDDDINFNWWSSDEAVFTVEGDGTATGQGGRAPLSVSLRLRVGLLQDATRRS